MRFIAPLTDLILTILAVTVLCAAILTYGPVALYVAVAWAICALIAGRFYVVPTFKQQRADRRHGQKTSYMDRWFRFAAVTLAPFTLGLIVVCLVMRFVLFGIPKTPAETPDQSEESQPPKLTLVQAAS